MLNIVFGLQDANSSPADASRIGKAAAVVGTWKKGVAIGSAICIRHPAHSRKMSFNGNDQN